MQCIGVQDLEHVLELACLLKHSFKAVAVLCLAAFALLAILLQCQQKLNLHRDRCQSCDSASLIVRTRQTSLMTQGMTNSSGLDKAASWLRALPSLALISSMQHKTHTSVD